MDKLQMQSKNLVDENIDFIAKRFPNCVTEAMDEDGKLTKLVDFEMLKQELSHVVIDGDKERYTMTWPDKKQAILTANAPISKTLRPCREESVGKDGTVGGFDSENLYIEGDNLDVLKLLRETYLGKVKMIYIDPPYNTGNDFVYNDDFATDTEDYLERSNQVDEQGNRMVTNNESNGRFHTDWLNMIYPRLKLAKDLLTDDGVIFISIDDNEQANMKKICDEIYGESNFINLITWHANPGGGKGDGIETTKQYVFVYAKSKLSFASLGINIEQDLTVYSLKDEKSNYRKGGQLEKWGNADTIYTHPNLGYSIYYKPETNAVKIKFDYNRDELLKNRNLKLIYQEFDKDLISQGYYCIRPRITNAGQPGRWRVEENTFMERFSNNDLIFEKQDANYKIYEKERFDAFKFAKMKDMILDIRQTNDTTDLFEGKKVFSYPKPSKFMEYLIKNINDKDFTILDFFSGSGTTAHAVIKVNAEDGGCRRFICVQIPENLDDNFKISSEKDIIKNAINVCDEINASHYLTEIAKERIRRAGKQVKEGWLAAHNLVGQVKKFSSKEDFVKDSNEIQNHILDNIHDLDIGFRVLKLDSSCMKDVYYSPNKMQQDLLTQLEDNIKEDRTPEDLLFQVMLDMGVLLSSEIKTEIINGKTVFNVNDGDLVCCFDKNIDDDTVTKIAKMQPLYAVFCDSSIKSDSVAVNFDQIFETYSHSTERRII